MLASLVIIGHAPEMIDGNRVREPLTRAFHTLALGDVAVDGFFLLSGFLITKSLMHSGSLREYLKRRVFRIYPAFVVAYLLSVYVLGPVVNAHPFSSGLQPLLAMVFLLAPPQFPGQMPGMRYPSLNGAIWTIHYEFLCYMIVAGLGFAGMLRRKQLVLVLAAVAMIWFGATQFGIGPQSGSHYQDIRFLSAFLIGTVFYLYRDALLYQLSGRVALICGLLAALLMFRDPHFAEVGAMVFGGTALFWLAFNASLGPMQRINDGWDISYGVYLYGWPIATFILWNDRHISPWALAAISLPMAMIAGTLSWWGLEKWAKDITRSSRPVVREEVAVDQHSISLPGCIAVPRRGGSIYKSAEADAGD